MRSFQRSHLQIHLVLPEQDGRDVEHRDYHRPKRYINHYEQSLLDFWSPLMIMNSHQA